MIILIFPHYTIHRDNGKVFLLTFRTQKIKANNHGKIRIFCESGEGK
ncbi:hypothetical protein ACN4A0_000119 [Klebsiella pneumoniae]|nr:MULTISPECIES: hypothetical protein [Klebsiella]MDW5830300.1 hypothetical protein [Klebsiella pneumoniae]